ncbi:hypothetical protein GW950_00600 [Candidatus Wolfebacteria bacterium]|nr:hypothetical protein [Candidatus Wolfebacteria bacterium]
MSKKVIAVALLALPVLVMAQNYGFGGLDTPQTGINSLEGINRVIVRLVNWVMGLFFVAATLAIFYAAYLYLSAAGNPDNVGLAKTALIYSVIAIAVALLAGSIRFIVESILS